MAASAYYDDTQGHVGLRQHGQSVALARSRSLDPKSPVVAARAVTHSIITREYFQICFSGVAVHSSTRICTRRWRLSDVLVHE